MVNPVCRVTRRICRKARRSVPAHGWIISRSRWRFDPSVHADATDLYESKLLRFVEDGLRLWLRAMRLGHALLERLIGCGRTDFPGARLPVIGNALFRQ